MENNNNLEILQLFPSVIGYGKIESSLFPKHKLIKQIESNYQNKRDNNNWRKGITTKSLHHMYNDESMQIDTDELIENVYPVIVKSFFDSIDIFGNLELTVVNYTAIGPGQGMDRHFHPNCDYTMVHYIKVPTGTSTIKFYNPSLYSYYTKAKPFLDKNNMLHTGGFFTKNLTPEEDSYIIFPNHLEHEVPISRLESDELRIAIVTNVNILPKNIC